jgi:hypothetical protein
MSTERYTLLLLCLSPTPSKTNAIVIVVVAAVVVFVTVDCQWLSFGLRRWQMLPLDQLQPMNVVMDIGSDGELTVDGIDLKEAARLQEYFQENGSGIVEPTGRVVVKNGRVVAADSCDIPTAAPAVALVAAPAVAPAAVPALVMPAAGGGFSFGSSKRMS